MNLLLWIGNEPNQKALANKLAAQFNIVGIVKESRVQKRKVTLGRILNYAYEKLFLSSINESWRGLMSHYENKYSNYPKSETLEVENINSEEAYNFSKNLKPDLIIVSGTRMVKSQMLSTASKYGILNLHTGLSPYIKGGPNCTNWCIATENFHLVGNTIMWIDNGIDSGNIVTTEYTNINWDDSLSKVHIDVMEHAHELYVKAVAFIAKGGHSDVPQSQLGEGKTFYTKDWKLKNKKDLIKNFRKVKNALIAKELEQKRKVFKTVTIKV